MSRRDAGAARQQARHARDRLQATLGEAPPGLLGDGPGGGFEYRGPGETGGTKTGGSETGSPGSGSGGVPSLRWRVGLRVALLLGALAVAAGACFWWQAGAGSPEVLPLSGASAGGKTAGARGTAADSTPPADTESGDVDGGETGGGDPGSGPGQPTPGGLVVVHVAGAVATPGVIRLQQGSRVDDAIAAAGGPVPDADVNRLNLALVVEDGQKIYVPQRGEPVPSAADSFESGGTDPGGTGAVDAGSSGSGSNRTGQPGAAAGKKINLNTADAAELDMLPKVGPVLAQRIVDWRKDHGPFTSVEELDAVDGVGPKMLEALLPLVTV
ncbi:helix-hairpin-helix domain-containing protein [Arthrobacter sp. SAFR-044]|uniref:helix-hairpin-helix domain-containing protein n=1 Tax=Arthrobacter sp. SAFR-044 TaxID=3387278 RepID=UPI003F7BD1B4